MPTREDEFEADAELTRRVIRYALRPYHSRIEKKVGMRLPAIVTVWTSDTLGPQWDLNPACPPARDLVHTPAEIRLRFRRTYRNDRSLWAAQAHVPAAIGWEGVCGYLVSGEILGQGTPRIRLRRTWTDRLLKGHAWRGWQW